MTTSKKNTLPTTNALLAIAGWDHAIDWEALGWAAIVRDGAITVWSPLEEANNSPGAFYTQYDLTPEQSGSLAVAPDPVPAGYLRGLIVAAGISQQEAARRLHVDPATLRRWLSPPTRASHRACPWAAAELLRRIVADQAE